MKKFKELDELTKTKVIMQGEYVLIALVFLVLGFLKIFGVINSDSQSTKAHIFNFITSAGSLWVISDFLWSSFSKKRHNRVDYIDKVVTLPIGLYLLVYNILCFINWSNPSPYLNKIGVSILFFMIFIVYMFIGIYHWFKTSKQVLKIIEEAKEEENKENK